MRARDETVYVATKIPPKNLRWPASPEDHADAAFPGEHIRACTERSLRNLGLERIDVQQFHVWHDDWLEQGDWLETVEALKQEGKIRCFGVSINDHEPGTALELVRSGRVDTVQVIYNVFDQSPEDELFPLCVEHGVGVLARVPFDEGGLTGRIDAETTFPEGDFRNDYFRGDRRREVAERVRGDRRRARRDRRGRARAGAALHPLRARRLHGDPRHALDPQRGAQHAPRATAAGSPPSEVAKLKRHRWVRNWYR